MTQTRPKLSDQNVTSVVEGERGKGRDGTEKGNHPTEP